MAIQTVSTPPDMTNLTTFKAWGLAISNGIVAAGFTRTADSGQINWSTVTPVPTTNVKAGYEIYAFFDAAQSTSPVVLRIDYGCGGNAGNPQLWITVGCGSNGSGTITAGSFTGALLAVQTVFNTTASSWGSTTANNIYIDSDGGSSLMIAGWLNATGSGSVGFAGGLLLVERTRDFDGTVNGEGAMVIRHGPNNAATAIGFQQLVITNAASFSSGTAVSTGTCLSGSLSGVSPHSGIVGNTLYFWPFFTGWTPRMHGPSKHVVGVWGADLPVNNQFTLTLYARSGTFNAIGPNGSVWGIESGNTLSGAFRIA